MKKSFPIWIPIVITALVLMLVGGFIAFMGVRGLIAVNASSTAQVNDLQTSVAGVNAIQMAPAGLTNCGEVSVSSGVAPSAAALDSALCFQFAFESCRPAQIALHNVDTGTTRTFVTGKQGTRCYIVLTTRFSDASKGPAPAPIQCLGEAMHTDGLHISGCGGENDVVIPVAQPGAVIMLNIVRNQSRRTNPFQ